MFSNVLKFAGIIAQYASFCPCFPLHILPECDIPHSNGTWKGHMWNGNVPVIQKIFRCKAIYTNRDAVI